MKLSTRDANAYFAKPDPSKAGLLIYGTDAMRVSLKRQQVVKALLGPSAEEEMRLTRLPSGDLRKDPAQLLDAVKAVGFFPGPRAVVVDEATDQAAPSVTAALQDWQPGDAQIVVTAGALKKSSALRKAFEAHPSAYAVGLYDDPPTRGEIETTLAEKGLRNLPPDALTQLSDLARVLGPGDFAQVAEKIALYKHGDTSPLTPEDIAACAPRSTEAEVDDVLNVVAEGRSGEIGPLIRRLQAQGATPVSLIIGAARHFKTLYVAASDPGGPNSGIGRVRPPVFGPRRDRIIRQAQGWGADKLETALGHLTETDLALRSAGQTAPQMALVERTFIRLATLMKVR